MSVSSRHHYLPVFYLKGFTDEDGLLNVFGVEDNTLKDKQAPPKSVFFEWDRNTIFLENGKTDFVEEMFKQLDNACAIPFEKLKNRASNKVAVDDLIRFRFFLSVLFWRIPTIDEDYDEFINGLTRDELKFRIVDKDGNDAPAEVFQTHFNDPNFRKAYRVAIPIVNYRIIKNDEVENWKFYFSTEKSFHVCGDSPIIRRNQKAKNLEETDFVFPLTDSTLLVHKKGERITQISPATRVKIDLLIFLQSQKYVCSSNRDYLVKLSYMRQGYNDKRIEDLRSEIFKEI